LAVLYAKLSVETEFLAEDQIRLTKVALPPVAHFEAHLSDTPDLAQTLVVSCLGLGIGCSLTGLQTLKIKETDRLQALYNELTKLGASVTFTNDALALAPTAQLHADCTIATYQDHRMAMAFAPLALRVPLVIENAEVVSKSYPNFWNDLEQLGIHFSMSEK
jgi:3-phosphoshikimate 1-carboxyvinyltransferase